MVWKIEVFSKEPESSFLLERKFSLFGISATIYCSKIYFVEGPLSIEQVEKTASGIVADPVVESYRILQGHTPAVSSSKEVILEVTGNPGVMDPEATSLMKSMKDMGFAVEEARTAKKYSIHTGASMEKIRKTASKVIYNPLIEHLLNKELVSLTDFRGAPYQFKSRVIDLISMTETEMVSLSRSMTLSLNANEMRTIQEYFLEQKRNPTDCELETIAQTWSEHCVHKTFKGDIEYTAYGPGNKVIARESIKNLFKSTIVKATKTVNSPYCVSVFFDNSGIVRFDETHNLCFKVETHNHPSALEPFGGASTGVGGVIRDIIGTGQGAYPIANTDVFCFGLPDEPSASLPEGVLHPKIIIEGVVDGVRDYGNKMGIPTVNGAILFDRRYLANPLVFCGCVGMIPRKKSFKEVRSECFIVVAGGHTGRDGIHGATFSSSELEESVNENSSFVQIGNAIEEKKALSAVMRARDEDLFLAITDCGAGGLSSAVGEIAKDHGAEVYLDKVPLKYQGLSYTEIWISESQERMVLVVEKKHFNRLKAIFEEESSELAVIGKVTDTHKLRLYYREHLVGDLDMHFLHDGVPVLKRKAVWKYKKGIPFALSRRKKDYSADVYRLLRSYNICSKEEVFRQYDHEVQGGAAIKPSAGRNSGPSDAALVRPVLSSNKAVAIGCGINPFYSDVDPYHMAACAIDEAVRNVLCVGGAFQRTALLDNFCWGNPEREKDLAGLVRAAKACHDMAVALRLPFISGKDSFYNEFIPVSKITRAAPVDGWTGTSPNKGPTRGSSHEKKRIVIPYTLLISAMSVVDDYTRAVSADFKKDGNLIYLVGPTSNALGAGSYARLYGKCGSNVPQVDAALAVKIFKSISLITEKGIAVSLHDCADGGLAVALAEMCFSSGRGANIFVDEVPSSSRLKDYQILFSESPSRFIVEVEPSQRKAFERVVKGIPYGLIGCVQKDPLMQVWRGKNKIVHAPVGTLQGHFTEGFPAIFRYPRDSV